MSALFRTGALPQGEGPLYLRLQALIRGAVEAGELKPADALPSERDLAEGMGISRVTVRKALTGLVEEGVVEQRQGSGTFVSGGRRKLQQGLSHLTSFSEDMATRGRRTTSDWLLRSLERVTPAEAMQLALSPGDLVCRIHRLRRADGVPLAIERACVPATILPDPGLVGASLYAAMAAAGRHPVRALQRISAANLSADEAALLGVSPGTAALAIMRVSFDEEGRPVELTQSHYRGDAYDFVAELSLSDQGRS
ncbi:GntR family transcriptional regulator [Antarcticirhabdus aurantiaca]|uniref:GntR family transcriptional regulator n=1 Tax=Antarcticirhabdus aurantiaca TaxID=2606717 RepID=A0ACD4NHG5_9HYPH|nr:GntR family transcriptional regulator [Antarcticirhabdus aurantiaca]WAJ26295.1 GntR family transcriptional regulator [Jeongeuplla avenae]